MCRYQQLSLDERYTISDLGESRKTIAEMARAIHRPPSTVLRERRRNCSNSDGAYRASVAESYATARRKRERRGFRHAEEQWQQVKALLEEKWSPEQIAGRLRLEGSFTISHETIYQYIWQDKKCGGTLFKNLRCSPKKRRKRHNTRDSRGILPGKRHISERPPEVETRKTFGHWEGDTLMGRDLHHCALTMVERKTGLGVINKMQSRQAKSVTKAATTAVRSRAQDFKTITFDNGTEFHGYKELEEVFPLKCYFATPYHSWERGSNENFNGLVRQYLPRGVSMRDVTPAQCDAIALKLNTRPRKRFGYRTPLEVYQQELSNRCTSSLNLSFILLRSFCRNQFSLQEMNRM
jgi:IS30 family transposase